MLCGYSKLVTLYKPGEVYFRLLGTNGYHVKAKKERFSATGWRFRQNLKYENFPSSFGRPRQKIAPKSVLHVQHDYFSSFNLLICDVVVDVAETPYNRHLPSDQGPVAASMISANHWGRSIGTYIFIW